MVSLVLQIAWERKSPRKKGESNGFFTRSSCWCSRFLGLGKVGPHGSVSRKKEWQLSEREKQPLKEEK